MRTLDLERNSDETLLDWLDRIILVTEKIKRNFECPADDVKNLFLSYTHISEQLMQLSKVVPLALIKIPDEIKYLEELREDPDSFSKEVITRLRKISEIIICIQKTAIKQCSYVVETSDTISHCMN